MVAWTKLIVAEELTMLSSVQFSHSVVSDSLRPHETQHAGPPRPSPFPGACSNSCSSSLWCHPTIWSSVFPISSWLQPFPASGSFQMSQFFASGGAAASGSVLPSSNEYSGLIFFRIDWFWFPCSPRDSQESSPTPQFKTSILRCSAFPIVPLSHPYMTTGKTIALTRWTFVGKVMSLLFNMLPRLVIAFLPRSKCLLISWQQSPSAVSLEPKKIKSLFPLFPHLFAMRWWDRMPWSLFFEWRSSWEVVERSSCKQPKCQTIWE